MFPDDSAPARFRIVIAFARWTALSALRSGRHLKSRADIYPLLDALPWDELLDVRRGEIGTKQFSEWHRRAIEMITTRSPLPVGWAAKLINVYLKTAVYVGGLGRPGLGGLLHPPLDAGLWTGLARQFGKDSAVCLKTHSRISIQSIDTYDTYMTIIEGCALAAEAAGCTLIEVEQWWGGAASPAV